MWSPHVPRHVPPRVRHRNDEADCVPTPAPLPLSPSTGLLTYIQTRPRWHTINLKPCWHYFFVTALKYSLLHFSPEVQSSVQLYNYCFKLKSKNLKSFSQKHFFNWWPFWATKRILGLYKKMFVLICICDKAPLQSILTLVSLWMKIFFLGFVKIMVLIFYTIYKRHIRRPLTLRLLYFFGISNILKALPRYVCLHYYYKPSSQCLQFFESSLMDTVPLDLYIKHLSDSSFKIQ